MLGVKKPVFAAVTGAALALAPITPAAAFGPFLPWILGRHVVGAVAALATLPLAAASSAVPAAAPYPPAPGYGGAPGYYPTPNYYAGAPTYYARPPTYYGGVQNYYRPEAAYGRSAPQFYQAPRGYSAPRPRYTGAYGAHVPYQSGRSAYRRR
jgi:hypothetical protein